MLNSECFREYNAVSENIKFITNSKIRLKILAHLFNKPSAMKDIHLATLLSYSSISSNISKLEEKKLVFRQANVYFLNNDIKCYLMNILDFNKSILFINNFDSLFSNHNIFKIPNSLLKQIYLLEDSVLIESTKEDIYMPYNTIEKILNEGELVKIILPFYYSDFLNLMAKYTDISFQLMPSKNIASKINEEILRKKIKNIKVINSDENFCFSLFLSNDSIAMGLFKKEGDYDQNRILYSKNKKSLKWGDELFNNILLNNSLN